MVRHFVRPVIAGALLLGGVAGASEQRASVPALAGIEGGQWQLRSADGKVRRICVGNRTMLLQLMHGTSSCDHVAIEGSPNAAVVRYSCNGHGNGRTSISVETPRLMTIETQGVADGSPFSEKFEARRTGTCG
jgi:hypothetical protein